MNKIHITFLKTLFQQCPRRKCENLPKHLKSSRIFGVILTNLILLISTSASRLRPSLKSSMSIRRSTVRQERSKNRGSASVRSVEANFGGLVLGCIEARQYSLHFPISKMFNSFCTAPSSDIVITIRETLSVIVLCNFVQNDSFVGPSLMKR